jgi:hypothetical protein
MRDDLKALLLIEGVVVLATFLVVLAILARGRFCG